MIGLSVSGVLKCDYVKTMEETPIIFAMANRAPKMTPKEVSPDAQIMAAGRSDYPNLLPAHELTNKT